MVCRLNPPLCLINACQIAFHQRQVIAKHPCSRWKRRDTPPHDEPVITHFDERNRNLSVVEWFCRHRSNEETPNNRCRGQQKRGRLRSLLGWLVDCTVVPGSFFHPRDPLSVFLVRDQLRIVQPGNNTSSVCEFQLQPVASFNPCQAYVFRRLGEDQLDFGCHMRIMGGLWLANPNARFSPRRSPAIGGRS